MYLKSIEVQGFKSFANKIKFDFHNGITGIVGPNGSGKSNVADAVRWVLGEQRVKQLRGGTMQDVIFSGTENRKPLSYASVAITLDNSDHKLAIDFEEVTVTRKLYRSGESEYLINGSACRLKDINELFYDTGIGKEGYSIIGQGQIDKILSGKPEERRELFDEAAGIVKFKRRKSMSVKKLEEEQQNLIRVNDILSELEKQVGPLERQSEKAREYLKKKEELKTYDINMFLLEADRLKEQIRDVEAKDNLTKAQMGEANRLYEDTKQEYESIEEQVDTMDASIETYNRKLTETSMLKQQLENQIALLKEQIHSARMNDEHYANRAQSIERELSEREEQLGTLISDQTRLQAELDSGRKAETLEKENLNKLQIRIASLSSDIEKNQNDIREILGNRASTKAQIQKFDTMMEQIQVRKSGLNQRYFGAQSEAGLQKEQYETFYAELKEVSDQIISFAEEKKNYESQIQELQKSLNEKNEQIRASQSAYHREHSRLESLRNMTERYDGYGNSIKRVMDNRSHEKGLLGVVADIIKVEKKYETAIETALGGSIQNIVTDNEQTAKRMIEFLKKNKFGRATFLPLTQIRSHGGIAQPQALNEAGVIGLADTLVMVEDKYLELAGSLLGRTLVVDHIDHGLAIARKYRQSIRIVTLEGDLINPGGSMTGGAFKNSSNLLSRRREIEELEQAVQRLRADVAKTEQEIAELKNNRSGYYDKIEQIKDLLQKAYVRQNTAKMNADQAKSKIEAANQTALEIQKETQQLDQEISDIMDNQQSINVELDTSEQLERDLNKQIEEGQTKLDDLKHQEILQQQASENAHLSCAATEQKVLFVMENAERIQEEMQKFREELKGLEASKGGTSKEIKEKESQIQELRQTIENSGELFVEIQDEIEKAKKTREDLNQRHKDFLQKREENLTDVAKMKKRIQELKGEIRALGNVNVNAIEDYKNVSERYEFLKTQHDDLVEAEATLEKIIAELDEAMRKQFTEQFAHICQEFDHVFKQLFGGGKGTLELMDDEDVLEAGIRIIAQPPGKKLQNMMQLSGGEKALTAISLLFAIQNLKPSPFCLLDEIEAALDDSNVDRFAQYLHKLTKNTQFIVITHRRGTMTAADRLYGITMQEKGISTLVSVSLLEDELDD